MDDQFKRSLDLLKQLDINSHSCRPYLKCRSMPNSLRISSPQTKFEEPSMITLNKRCLAVLQNKLPMKKKDLKRFTIPCMIGNLVNEKALVDLGASINVMQ